MDRIELVSEKIFDILNQAMLIVSERKYGLNINYVYYSGGTLCIDILDIKTNKVFLVMINISSEKVLIEKENGEYISRLLPIKALKLAFDIYAISKGKTEYYLSTWNKSCLRHLNC